MGISSTYSSTKHIGKSDKYKYVYIIKDNKTHSLLYSAVLGKRSKMFINERDAAIAVDRWLLESGKQPVNILIKK